MTFWELSPALVCCCSGQYFLSSDIQEPQSEGFLFPGGAGCVRCVNGDTTDNHPARMLLAFYSLDMEQQMKLELAVDKYTGDCSWNWAVRGVLPCGLR